MHFSPIAPPLSIRDQKLVLSIYKYLQEPDLRSTTAGFFLANCARTRRLASLTQDRSLRTTLQSSELDPHFRRRGTVVRLGTGGNGSQRDEPLRNNENDGGDAKEVEEDATCRKVILGHAGKFLRFVQLAGCPALNDDLMELLVDSCPAVVKLNLSNNPSLTDRTLYAVSRLRRLRRFDSSGYFVPRLRFSDDGLLSIAEKCRELVRLDVGWSRNTYTREGMVRFLETAGPKLRLVDARRCYAVKKSFGMYFPEFSINEDVTVRTSGGNQVRVLIT